MASKLPLIAWGDPDDIRTWLQQTVTVTAGASGPFGLSDAFMLDDDTSETISVAFKVVNFTRDGSHEISVFLKAGTSDAVMLGVFDDTAVAGRHYVAVTWSDGTPTVTTHSEAGTIYTPIAVGNGWWLIRFTAENVIAANLNSFLIYVTGTSLGTPTGTVYAYMRNVVVLGSPLHNAVADEKFRDGSIYGQAPSGVEDAWIVGSTADNQLRATMRWIPRFSTDNPSMSSGYFGANESVGVNCGIKAMLNAGRKKTVLRFCPDRSDATSYVDSYLFEPMDGGIALEEDGTRAIDIGLRNPDGNAYEDY